MNKDLKLARSVLNSPASFIHFNGDVYRRVGNIQTVARDGRRIDQDPGMAKAILESIELTFGSAINDDSSAR